ncbi:MAG: hypothetical protein A2X56_03130 [Nitrospirae bacterium GWC2_57_13]|jgi:uncharacterized protein YutE (UPF0331/DUF86 family)|nr:MAG: hypothetical protein A2X56_03130 [Nitrospirae bacterium GWC2_57_13]OGW45756.1 MAG: hypothetical protein A2X57_04805 [Nitrospirae bacterium GWD2_57_8]HAR46354.1 DUF86 domain-containing protein [Nitrospiraceae bacterium]HAS53285.1 DUF86 domain-containing protein [Nitrospiraceae bacterium]
MMINEELVRTRCQEIEDSLERLERIKASAKEKFLTDRDLQDIASYRLLVAIEAALGLCYHIAAKQLKRVPEEYAECFTILSEAGIINRELSEKLQKTARFRNLLVHMYWKIDYGAVYEILHNDLEDLRRFSQAVAALI